MLVSFRIHNLYLIEDLEIQLDRGFVAITGESGAGKSMIVRALTLLTGRKASGQEVRENADKGFIEAVFLPDEARSAEIGKLVDEYAFEWILRRDFRQDGRSRAFVNDSPVTNATLGEIAKLLMRFSLQEDVGALRDPARQMMFVDAYAHNGSLLEDTGQKYRDWKQAFDRIQELRERSHRDRSALEWLRTELNELTTLQYQPGEVERLKQESELQKNIESVRTAYLTVSETLDGERGSAVTIVNSALTAARNGAHWDERLNQFATRIEEISIDLRELARDANHDLSRINGDPQRIEALEQRLQRIFDCEHKWHLIAEAIPDRVAKLQETVESYDTLDIAIIEAERHEADCMAKYHHSANTLSERRKIAADALFAKAAMALPAMGIQHPQLVSEWSCFDRPTESGVDQLTILFSANPDVQPRELGEVISGGELARLELSLLSVCDADDPVTLILDEVDRGVSGKIASAVGMCLRRIGNNRPIAMVTHLPQVAAAAHQHIAIEKKMTDQHTSISSRNLGYEERIQSLAEMLSGSETGSGARQGAIELLSEFQHL